MKIASLLQPRKKSADEESVDVAPARRDEVVSPKRRRRLGRTIAVHFDQHQLQMAAVVHGISSRRLIHVRSEAIPGDLRSDEERQRFVGHSVAHYVKKHGGPLPQVYVTLDGPDTAIRNVVLPQLKSKNLKAAVTYEAKRQIPFPIEQAVFDQRVVSKTGTAEQPKSQVLVFAATEPCVASGLTPLHDEGVHVHRVYHTQDAVGSLLRSLPDFDPREIYAVAQISNRRVEVAFFRGSALRYWHVSRSQIAWPDTPDGRLSEDQTPLIAEQIAQEVQLAFDFYAGKFSDGMASQIYVHGNHVIDDALLSSLYQSAGIECIRFPIEQIAWLGELRESSYQTVLASLPVVASAASDLALANLLPDHLRNVQRRHRIDRLAVLGHAAVLLILAVGWYTMYEGVNHREQRLTTISTDVSQLQSSAAFRELQMVTRQNALDRAFLNMVKKSPTFLSLTLKEISNLADRRITLTGLNYESTDGDNMLLQGKVVSSNIPPEIILAEFMKNLSASPMFDNVVADRHVKRREDGRLEMEFVLRLRGLV